MCILKIYLLNTVVKMKNRIRVLILAFFCLYSLFFVIGSVLAPIAAHFQYYDLSAELTALYVSSCHQEADRVFWISGYPAALCCRCLGFYLGVVLSCIAAMFNKLKIGLKIFLLLCLLTFIDILINYGFGIRAYNTGNITRFFIGMVMGLLFVVILQFLYERISKLCLKN